MRKGQPARPTPNAARPETGGRVAEGAEATASRATITKTAREMSGRCDSEDRLTGEFDGRPDRSSVTNTQVASWRGRGRGRHGLKAGGVRARARGRGALWESRQLLALLWDGGATGSARSRAFANQPRSQRSCGRGEQINRQSDWGSCPDRGWGASVGSGNPLCRCTKTRDDEPGDRAVNG